MKNAGKNSEKCIPKTFDQGWGFIFWLPGPNKLTEFIVLGVKLKLSSCSTVPGVIDVRMLIITGVTVEKPSSRRSKTADGKV